MSADFQTVLVTDSTINDITPDLEYGVKSGASSTTYQSFPASSPSNSSVTFSIQVLSENVIVSRDVLITTGLSLTINIGAGLPLMLMLLTMVYWIVCRHFHSLVSCRQLKLLLITPL